MLGWLKGKTSSAPAPAQARPIVDRGQQELAARIERRFPPSALFRIPPELAEALNKDDIRENPVDPRWVTMLEEWPEPPRTEQERAHREFQFWNMMGKNFLRKDNNGSWALAPRGEIQDYFENNEFWVFRHFYAATGERIQTTLVEGSNIIIRYTYASRKLNRSKDGEDIAVAELGKELKKNAFFYNIEDGNRKQQRVREKEHETEAARSEWRRLGETLNSYANVTRAAHMEKWGGWFRNGIETRFKQALKDEAGQGDATPNVYGDGGYATLDDVKENERRQAGRNSPQSQRFD